VQTSSASYRVYSFAAGSQVIQVAQDLEARQKMASTLAFRTVGPMVVMVPLLMLVVWWVVSASLAPVARVRQQVAARQANDLSEVSEVGLPDEILPLVHELNLLLQRMRQAFEAQKNFVADAAHELRSPLAALKLQVQGLSRAVTDATREVAVTRLTAGIDRATRLVEQLLVLARQQSSTAGGAKARPVDLSAVARSALTDAVGAAVAKHIDLGLDHADYGLVMGHEEALYILVRNLLDNAIKYTPVGGKIDLAIHCRNAQVVLTVDDNGPGIPAQDRERVLHRFYRVPGAEATGSGLGLAIVRAVVDLHGASMALDLSPSLGGLQVRLIFPVKGVTA
jgi:two-component system OmpR family sensor kinase